jgi:3-oxoacyl-[acyl-carrier-protein] synthase-1
VNGLGIIGVGASTPLGVDALTTSAAYRAAISSMAEHPVYLDSRGDRVYVSRDPRLSPTLDWPSRVIALARAAASEAISGVLTAVAGSARDIDVFIAMPERRPGTVPDVEGNLSREIVALTAPSVALGRVAVAWQGHASGLLWIQQAAERMPTRRGSLTLVLSVDSYLSPETLEWLEANKQLKREGRTSGFLPGEAAAAVLLAHEEDAARWETPMLARVLSCGSAKETNRIKTDTICVGDALTTAMRAALQPLAGSTAKVTDGYCDLNGERYRNEELMYAIVRVSPLFVNAVGYATPADCLGDVGAASGLLYLTLAVVAGMRGYAKGGFALAWAGSENGYRAAVLLQLPAKQSLFQ